MAYSEHTHCPNCFKPSYKAVCPSCSFDRNAYLQQQAASHHLPLFTVLDKGYVLGRVLGEGSFAIVYAAIREKDLLPCAVKEYYPHDLAQRGLDGKTVNPKRNQEQLNTWQNRFIQEGELLRCCYDYPSVESGVVRYMAMVKQHGTAYLVMERLNGDNLAHYLNAQKSLSGEAICLWLKPLLETLQKLHAKEIYHRDISPNNIFLCAPNYPVLMDFGLAREGVRDEVLKSSTLGAGTFIAPEQVSGGYCDQRTDLYALGAVIYLCLHGEAPPPVEARRQGAQLKQLPQPSPINAALERVASRCLQLELQSRPQNAVQLLAELAPFWAASNQQTSSARQDFRTIIPDQAQPNPPIIEQRPQPPENQQTSSSSSFLKTFLKLAFWAGLAYGGFFAYQKYTEEQAKITKEERRLFAKAKTMDDFKKYLSECQICEEKQTATAKIAELEKEQQLKAERQKKKKQEHQTYLAAQTVDDLKKYLATCELCLDKADAESELKQLEEKAQAQAQPSTQSSQPSQPSLMEDVINTVTKPIVEGAKQAVEEIKKPFEEAVTQSAEEMKKQQKAKTDKLQKDLEEALKKSGLGVKVQEEKAQEKPAQPQPQPQPEPDSSTLF